MTPSQPPGMAIAGRLMKCERRRRGRGAHKKGQAPTIRYQFYSILQRLVATLRGQKEYRKSSASLFLRLACVAASCTATSPLFFKNNLGNRRMWPLIVAALVINSATASDDQQAAVVGDVSDALGFTWPSPAQQQVELAPDHAASPSDVSDAVVFEDDAGAASELYMTEQGRRTTEMAGEGEAGSGGWGVLDSAGAIPADTDVSYMDTHIIHAPVEGLTVVSSHGRHSESSDAQTTLTRCDSRGEAWWTLQQAPNSCSLVWFNASWPLVSRYEVVGAHGTESCDPSDNSVFWLGMFQFEDTGAVDMLFDSICGGELDLRWTLLGDHVEMMAPSPVLNARSPGSRINTERNVNIGPTPTANGAAARRNNLAASGTVFMIVRNGCGGPINAHLRQDVSAQLDVPLSDLFAVADIMIIVLMILAASGFVFAAILLCQALGSPICQSETGEKQSEDAYPWAEGRRLPVAPVAKLISCALKDGDDDAVSSSLLKRTRSTVSSVSQ
eukprot:jgi/Ulvmu1/11733/UM008_0146.1